MNKSEKAVWNKLKKQYADDIAVLDVICAGENAVEKQTPKNPINIKEVEFKGSIRNKFKSGDCPCCKNHVDTDDDFKFCGECGQRLGW